MLEDSNQLGLTLLKMHRDTAVEVEDRVLRPRVATKSANG